MTQTASWTPEMQAAVMGELGAIKQGLASRQKQSAVQSVLASWADGLGEVGQSGAAFLTLVGCGGGIGMGLDLMSVTSGAVDIGLGAGMILGGLTVGGRVVLDQLLGEFIEFIQRDRVAAPPEQASPSTPQPPSASPEMEMGLQVDDGRGGWVTLLPDLPRHQVLRMAQRTAVGYLSGRVKKKNFSKRYLGSFWGDHLNDAKERLAAIGHIVIVEGNKTYTFTDDGVEWLERVIDER